MHLSHFDDCVRSPLATAGAPATVLLVEDERAVRVSLARYLQSVGYHVVQAFDVDQAIAATERHDFAAAVLDVGLPDPAGLGRSGLDVLTRMCSRRPGRPPTPTPTLIVFTGYALTPEQQAFVRSHGARIMTKPTEYRVLVDHLNARPDSPYAA